MALSIIPLVGMGAMTLSRYSRTLTNSLRLHHTATLSYAMERIRCITTVRLNDAAEIESERFQEMQTSAKALAVRKYSLEGVFMSFLGLTSNLSLVAVLRYGGQLIAQGEPHAMLLACYD